jgi:hypothetical protein
MTGSNNSSTGTRTTRTGTNRSETSNNAPPKKLHIKLHTVLIFILSILSFFLSFFISKSINYGYCNKTHNELCDEPTTEKVDDKDYMTCKNKNKYKPYDFTYIINVVILPLVIPTIIGSIGYLIYEYLENKYRIYKDIAFIINILLIILLIIQFTLYNIYKNSCMQTNYKCMLTSELKLKNDTLGYVEYDCVPNIHELSNVNYNIVNLTNHIIKSITIFVVILTFYLLDKQISIPADPNIKISSEIDEKLYIIISTIIFITNLVFPDTYVQYIINTIYILLAICALIEYKYI